jgi:hypothetical protein
VLYDEHGEGNASHALSESINLVLMKEMEWHAKKNSILKHLH